VLAGGQGLRDTWLGGVYVRADATRFVARDGLVLPDLQLLPANNVSGMVTYNGQPAHYWNVHLYRWAPTLGMFLELPSQYDSTTTTGSYKVMDLRPGSYTLLFDTTFASYEGFEVSPWEGPLWLNGQAAPPAGPGASGVFTVNNWENVTRDIDLAAKLVPATGRVLVNGLGLSGAYVNFWLWDAKTQVWNYTNWDYYYDQPFTTFFTQPDGTFSLGVPRGLMLTWTTWKPGYGEGSRSGVPFPTPPSPGVFDTSGVTGTLHLGSVPLEDIRILPTSPPRMTGVPVPGHLLTTTTGTWNKTGVTFTYHWLREGVPIRNATHKTYLVRTQDLGHRVNVRVTAHLAGWYDGTALSNAMLVHR
jgi:hypothetical protein